MDRIKQWLDQFESRSLRERSLLLLTTLTLLTFLVYLLWISPQLSERQRWLDKISKVEQETALIALQMGKLETVMKLDPNKENQQQLNQLKATSEQLDNRLNLARDVMISPQLVPEVLQDMLDELPLVLRSLRKLPPEIEIDSGVEGVPRVYRHGLRLELEGSYSNTLDYIERLERLPWGLAWEALDIRMQDYPKANIILHLYTLSFEEEWLGV